MNSGKVRAVKCKASSSKSLIQSSMTGVIIISAGSRPWDNWVRGGGGGGGGAPQTLAGLPKKFLPPFGPQFGLKIRGWGRAGPRTPPLDPPLIIKICDPSCHRGSSSSVMRSRTRKVASSILTWNSEFFWAFLCLSLNYSVEKHRVYLCTKEKMMSLLWSLFSGNFVN